VDRLVGLALASSVGTLTLLVAIQGDGQSSYLIVPLVLVLLSFAGTLVYTRLLGPKP
jgi:multisubunit Na+/H+ antiporter MnhF subunit